MQGLPFWLPGRTELVVQKAQECASILGPPASPGLTGGCACEALSPSSRAADEGPCPAGSRWPVTHLSHLMGTGLEGQGPSGALRSSAQEFGNGPCVGPGRVFHMLLALGEGPERGWPASCRGATGRAVGCGAQSPPTPPLSVPKAIHRELAEARRPLPDTCSHTGAQLAPHLPLRAQTQTPYLLPLPHSLPRPP